MYLVETAREPEEAATVNLAQGSKVETLEITGESAPVASSSFESFEHSMSIATMLGAGLAVPMSVVATHGLSLEFGAVVSLLAATVFAGPIGVIGWRVRAVFRKKRGAGSLSKSSVSQPKSLEAPVSSGTVAYRRSDRAPRYRSQGNSWKSSTYSESYWQGYMDSIYCDYEDNHLDRPSNY